MTDRTKGRKREAVKVSAIEQAAKEQIYAVANVTAAASAANSSHEGAVAPDAEDIKDFTGRTQRNFEVAGGFGLMFFQMATETSQMWFQLARKISERNLDALTRMGSAKSLQEATQIQQAAIRDSLEDFASGIRSLTERSSKAA